MSVNNSEILPKMNINYDYNCTEINCFRLHLTEGSVGATPGYTVSSLTSTSHHLNPNPITKHEGATFFSGEPLPPPPRKIVVGAESAALPPVPAVRDNIVVGHTGDTRAPQPEAKAAPVRSGIVIGNFSGAKHL